MMYSLIKTKTVMKGICCNSCQEDVNVPGCEKCLEVFVEDETIYCQAHSQMDSEHYHEKCKP